MLVRDASNFGIWTRFETNITNLKNLEIRYKKDEKIFIIVEHTAIPVDVSLEMIFIFDSLSPGITMDESTF